MEKLRDGVIFFDLTRNPDCRIESKDKQIKDKMPPATTATPPVRIGSPAPFPIELK